MQTAAGIGIGTPWLLEVFATVTFDHTRTRLSPSAPARADEFPAPPPARLLRLSRYLALAYLVLIIYASLYPFANWRDLGVSPLEFIDAAWPRYWTVFDLMVNVLAYVPLGFLLVALALRRLPGGRWTATLVALLLGSLLSLAMEFLQNWLPGALSWMFRSSKLPWSGLLQASRSGCGSPSAPGLSSPTGCRRYRTGRPAAWRSHAGGSSPASRNPAHAKAICLVHSLQSLRKDRLRANACCRSMRAEKAGWSVVSP